MLRLGQGGGVVRGGPGRRLEGVPRGQAHADGPASAGSGPVVTQIGEVVFVLGVVRAVLRGRIVRVVVDGECGGDEVCKVDAAKVRAEEPEDGEDVGLRVAVEDGEDDGGGGEQGVRLIGRGRAAGDAGCDVEGDGGLAGGGVSGDERELAEGDAVGPEPVGGLLDKEFEGMQARFDRAGGGVELGAGHEAAFGEGVEDLGPRAAGAFEVEAAVRVVGDPEGGDHGVVVGRAVELAGVGAGAAGDAASEGGLEALDVGGVLRGEHVGGDVAFGHGSGLGSHGDMVGRRALGAQRARVTYSTGMGRMGGGGDKGVHMGRPHTRHSRS